VGVKVPARRTESEPAPASRLRCRNRAKAVQGSPSSVSLGEVAVQAVARQPLEELVLAAVAAVEGGDADAGAVGDGGDGGGGVVGEDLAGGLQDALVVAGRLGAAAAHRRSRWLHAPSLPLERRILFCYSRTEQFVL
jgi:hypothetical protein